jgi:hypothetical protein
MFAPRASTEPSVNNSIHDRLQNWNPFLGKIAREAKIAFFAFAGALLKEMGDMGRDKLATFLIYLRFSCPEHHFPGIAKSRAIDIVPEKKSCRTIS